MAATIIQITSPLFPGHVFVPEEKTAEWGPTEAAQAIREQQKPKLKKDGTEKKIVCNKKKGRKSEVYPINIPDMKKLNNYFIEHEMWEHYLIFVLSCNMARRIGDTLSFTWERIFDPESGLIRTDLLEIVEQKTDKLANPHINSACRAAINLYLEKTGVDPSKNGYLNPVFLQTSGNYKGHVITDDGYRKGLKKAANALGITYNIGTHSPRKTFGMITKMLHPGDYNCMELLQTIYNHADTKTTKRYIGLTKKEVDAYYDDFGDFFCDYVTGDKVYEDVAEKPIISLDANDLRDLITAAYKRGLANANDADPSMHIDAINELIGMVDELRK